MHSDALSSCPYRSCNGLSCRYNAVLAEVQRVGGSGAALAVPSKEERLMNQHEAEILSAFLGLFK